MRSKRLRVSAAVSTVGWSSLADLSSADISALLFLNGVDTGFCAGLAQQFLVLDDFLQEAVQFLVPDETTPDVRQAGAQLEQLAQRGDLLSDPGGLKIVHALEIQLDIQLGIVLAKTIRHFERQPWADFQIGRASIRE